MLEQITILDSFLHPDKKDALNILKADHERQRNLFDEFQDKKRKRNKMVIVQESLDELRMHAEIEEKIFYPTVRRYVEKGIMNEANEEHHVAKLLTAELLVMNGQEEHFDAKFHVLGENIKHHLDEEEQNLFPKVRALPLDMVKLGERLLELKAQLRKEGIPASLEEKYIKAVGAMALDSPAKNAKKVKVSASKAAADKRKAVQSKVSKLKPVVPKKTAKQSTAGTKKMIGKR